MTLAPVVPRVVFAVALAGAIVWAAANRQRLDFATVDTWISGLGAWGPVAFVALYAAATPAFLPGALFSLAGGAIFGPVWGSVLNLVGATIGAGVAFLAARYLAGEWVTQKSGGFLARLIAGVDAQGWRFVALVRLVPLFPFNLTNYALGLTRIRFVPYLATSFVCMAPGAIAYTWLGYAGRDAAAGNMQAVRYGLLGLGAVAAVAFLPRLFASAPSHSEKVWRGSDEPTGR